MLVVTSLIVVNAIGGGSGGLAALGGNAPQELSLSKYKAQVRDEQVTTAEWQGEKITGKLTSGKEYKVKAPANDTAAGDTLEQLLDSHGVEYDLLDPPASQQVLGFLTFLLPFGILIALFYFFFIKPAQAGGNQAANFGRSKAKRAGENTPKVTFDDVAGIEEAKQELSEVVDYLKNTKRYVQLGAKIPKGILLTGPPGVGKTHLARAIAGEAAVPFFHISGSDFVEMFVGVGAARVRDLFETAKAHKPCLIFVDEIDAVGRQRGAGLGGGHDEREQTLNQLLVEMDGFDSNTGVIMIAATNRPDVLDPALLRPGRFDRQIVVDPPDVVGREAILGIHAKGKPLAEDVELQVIAKRTPGFTGADLANSLNESALLAARHGKTKIFHEDIEEALDRVMAGPQRKSRVMDEKEREVIAFHEAGHAVIGEILEHSDPVHKVTILPRGASLGSTWSLPEKDTYLVSEHELHDMICSLLGGRVAEESVFDEVWTGASNDLERVSRIARAMVTEYGMSDKLGTLAIGKTHRNPFLGRDYAEDRNYSEDVARLIDEEVRQIVETNRERAEQILTEHRSKLDAVAAALLERETIDREEFLVLMDGRELPEFVPAAPKPEPESSEPEQDPASTPPQTNLEPDPA